MTTPLRARAVAAGIALALCGCGSRPDAVPALDLRGHAGWVLSVAFDREGSLLASAGDDGWVIVWDVAGGRRRGALRAEEAITAVAFSPGGHLAAGTWNGRLGLWEPANGVLVRTFRGHMEKITSLAFDPSGRRLASGSDDDTLRLWDAETGEDLRLLGAGNEYDVTSVAFSPDGERIASGDGENTLRIWDAGYGEEVLVINGHEGTVTSVSFSPDGRRLVSGSRDGTVRLWDSKAGKRILVLRGHAQDVNAVAFSPDGRRIASAGDDGTARIWEAESGKLLATFPHAGAVMCLAFSPDGSRLVTGTRGVVSVWTLSGGDR